MPTLTTGTDLSAWRHRLGWSVAHAAAELRVQATSLRNLEAERKQASPTILRLAELLELRHAAPAPVPASAPRPARIRKPKPVPVYADAFEEAMARARVTRLPAEAVRLLRAEVDRLRAGGGWTWEDSRVSGENLEARREREDAWHVAAGCDGPLHLVASGVERALPK